MYVVTTIFNANLLNLLLLKGNFSKSIINKTSKYVTMARIYRMEYYTKICHNWCLGSIFLSSVEKLSKWRRK
ncbi:MAG TPA: hypothetical protein DIU28_14525 [Anabaena sp. UBA12330]|nr:hypothetical protein [Anabaena sp. UBA12330]